jgi:hypothetical protein
LVLWPWEPPTSETHGENRHVEVSSLHVTRGDIWVSMTWPRPWKIVCVGRNHIFQVEIWWKFSYFITNHVRCSSLFALTTWHVAYTHFIGTQTWWQQTVCVLFSTNSLLPRVWKYTILRYFPSKFREEVNESWMINASWSCFFSRDFLNKFADESMDLGGPVLFLSCAMYCYVFE